MSTPKTKQQGTSNNSPKTSKTPGKSGKPGAPATPGDVANPGASPNPAAATPEDHPYTLTPARSQELLASAHALGDNLVFFPGRSRDRVRWAHRIQVAATKDAAELVRAPFFGEPGLTAEEIAGQRDQIELFRACESEFQARRLGQAGASREFARLSGEATAHKDNLLRAFDLRFRGDAEGQKRVSQIRAGVGDADLVQDVSDVLLLASEHIDYLEGCPRGEGESVRRLREISPQLSRLLGAKTLSDEARAARRLRDGAYTLVVNTERRMRAAAEYWYGGTEKMREYAAYVAPSAPGAGESEEAEGEPVQLSEPAPGASPAPAPAPIG